MTFEEQASGASMSIGGTTWVGYHRPGGSTALEESRSHGLPPGRRPSPETDLGFERADRFSSADLPPAARHDDVPAGLAPGGWGLAGPLEGRRQEGPPSRPGGRFAYRFCARDLQLVQAPEAGPRQRSR